MIIEVCGRAEAVERVAAAREAISVISITSTDEPAVAFPPNEHLLGVLRLRFNDLTSAWDEEGLPYGRPLPQMEDFDGLSSFVRGLQGQRLIVHCWEGVSRSAAVAMAIYEYRGRQDQLVTQERTSPNPRVYALARRALGMPFEMENVK